MSDIHVRPVKMSVPAMISAMTSARVCDELASATAAIPATARLTKMAMTAVTPMTKG